MLRYLKYLFLALVAVCLVVLALANRQPVTLQLLPEDLALWVGVSLTLQLPLFLVILGGVLVGLLVGFIWEWLREHRHRADGARQRRERLRLEREVESLKGGPDADDDVLALVDDRRRTG